MSDEERTTHFAREWKAFRHAFLRSRDPFNPFVWIYRLTAAAGRDVGEKTGLARCAWRRIVPGFAVALILLVAASYFGKFRHDIVRVRWCKDKNAAGNNDGDTTLTTTSATDDCTWVFIHDGLNVYFTIMVLYHFLCTMYSSPGFLVAEDDKTMLEQRQHQGSSSIDIAVERERTRLFYGSSAIPNQDKKYFPDPNSSFCKKCNSERPPRCHHCSVCDRCILQYDHHCLWLNNCIGYNNRRSFILTLVYITAACWYAVLLLYVPFYEPLQEQLRPYGGLWNYAKLYYASNNATDFNEKGLFDIPSVAEFTDILLSPDKTLPVRVAIDIIFPLVFGVGAILAFFLGTHVKYILTARTTLEDRIRLEAQYKSLIFGAKQAGGSSSRTTNEEETPINLYDRGYYQNWTSIMGSNWIYLLLPLPFSPPPPYTPEVSKKKQK